MSSNRTAAIIVVAILHVFLGYALVTGLAYNVIKKAAEDMKTFDVKDEPPPPPEAPPPPPEPQPNTPPPIVSPPPLVRTNTVSPVINTVREAPPVVITPTAPQAPPAPPAPPPAPVKVQPARAKGSLPGLFSTDDYPPDALRNEQQGTTAVRLTIGADGRVSGCDVTASSGSPSLDSATCRIIRARARYTPAKGSDGKATGDTDSARIRWVVPAD